MTLDNTGSDKIVFPKNPARELRLSDWVTESLATIAILPDNTEFKFLIDEGRWAVFTAAEVRNVKAENPDLNSADVVNVVKQKLLDQITKN
jgi:hypothetical protein